MYKSFEGAPEMPIAKSPETRQENPGLMAYVDEKVHEKAKMLLVDEKLSDTALARISNALIVQLEKELKEKGEDRLLTNDDVSELFGKREKEVDDIIINGTIVRLDTPEQPNA